MKIEIVKTLKCSNVWKKGTVFDDTVSPIPGDILNEVKNGSNAVRVIAAEKPIAAVEPEIEIEEPVEEITSGPVANKIGDLAHELSQEITIEKTLAEESLQQETTSEFTFPELEWLIKEHTSVKAVAHLLNVSYQTIFRWRSGKSKPKAKVLNRIKREYRKVKSNDQE